MHEAKPRVPPRLVDAALVAGVALVGVGGLAALLMTPQVGLRDIPLSAPALVLVQAGALWWRRRRPLVVLGVTLAALLTAQALGDVNASSFLGVHAAAYAAGVYEDRRVAIAGLVGIGAAAAVEVAVVELDLAGVSYAGVGPSFALAAIAWGIGRYVHVRRDYLATLVAYAHQLEVDRDEKVHRAVLEERRRIARELHDQVAHHLGVAALQTGAARTWLEKDTGRSCDAMESAEEAVRAALTTMPVILEALRADGASEDFAPQPTLADLDELVDRVARTGLDVEVRAETDVRAVPPTVEVTAYRIVQEALTNTMKHADATRVTVRLRVADQELDVEVRDNGGGQRLPGEGAGLGLIGMRERVEVLGGTLEAGPRDDGGFTVHARLPLTAREGGGRGRARRRGRVLQ